MYYVGFDIGGSSVKVVLVRNKKIVVSQAETLPRDYERLRDLLKKMFHAVTAGVEFWNVKGVGVSVAGAFDAKREIMLNSPNIIYLNGKRLRKDFSVLFGLPVKIEHDVHCFLLAESKLGYTKGKKSVFYITFGTGIGGAWLYNGELHHGAHGSAGEIGHIIMNLKEQAGKTKIEDWEYLASNKFLLRELKYGSMEAEKKAIEGDKKVILAYRRMGERIGMGVANAVNILDPDEVVLGGGIFAAYDFLMPFVKETAQKYIISPHARKVSIRVGRLGRLVGALRAALLFDV